MYHKSEQFRLYYKDMSNYFTKPIVLRQYITQQRYIILYITTIQLSYIVHY
jgi:hypothetical protein